MWSSSILSYKHLIWRYRTDCLILLSSQNILLFSACGIPDDKLVEAHGSFATASCHLCYTPYPAEEAKVRPALLSWTTRTQRTDFLHSFLPQDAIINGNIPTCSFCAATVKPDVVFFGEDLPQKYFLHTKDFPKADLLIIMGTSLQVNIDLLNTSQNLKHVFSSA